MLSYDVEGSRFLDLFSGSGAIGIEALSRGARAAVFVENNRKAARCIRENLEHTHLAERAVLMEENVMHVSFSLLPASGGETELALTLLAEAPGVEQAWESKRFTAIFTSCDGISQQFEDARAMPPTLW